MERALRDKTVLAEEVAVTGGEDYDCVVGEPELVQSVQHSADACIDQADHRVVDGNVPPELSWLDQVAGEAVVSVRGFLRLVEVGLRFLSLAKPRGHSVPFPGYESAGLHVLGPIHLCPWPRRQLWRMWILETCPDEERPPGGHGVINGGYGALGGPMAVVELFG